MPPPTGGLSNAPEARTRYGYPWIISDAKGETMVLLVRVDQTAGLANHIPDASGHALCKRELKLSLWRIEERLVDETLICNICRVKQAKLARS